ncbi:NADAR family protein [Bacteroides sp. 224]|uniref:NADAR family protein n=1 Tax=Bacteroides sp. 224 TaxID=2302936 RepID=UPI0013CF6279|nr:NADAR family protein [Bacteroides sp. 224]NDV67035.1 NADAR family protein [Bacteroides sp. 224]
MKTTHATYNINWLLEKVNQGENISYLFFWGHTNPKDGITTKSCFSQWYPSPFTVEGTRYDTAEHWMMAKKAELFGDKEVLEGILKASTPHNAKNLGRKVRNFDPQTWDENCFSIVCEGNYHKFSQHSDLKTFLLNTDEKVLVEASPMDKIWGIGMGENNKNASNPNLWKGVNLLGFALMEVRDRLKSSKSILA